MTTTGARYASAMRVAIDESSRARGRSTPNPPVGAIIVDDNDRIVGRGHTQPVGDAHAEVMALRDAGHRARGATAVVTLEPCDHEGRTGPCTQALLAAGVTRVVYAVDDPTPNASGGSDTLRSAGIDVHAGLLFDAVADGPLREWLFRQRTGRPHVTAKIAATLDGRIAAPDGTSQWITGEVARARVHLDRTELDAIVVGTGTVLRDNPTLTARSADGTLRDHQPTRVVVGDRPIPIGARILDGAASTVRVPGHRPGAVLEALGDAVHVLVEGGPTLLGAFFAAGLVDRVQVYLAPTILGAGAVAVADTSVRTLTDAHRFIRSGVEILGEDILLTLTATS